MKTLLSLCFILLFVCSNSAAQDDSPVLDVIGDKLEVGSKYNVVSLFRGAYGGGLTLSNYGNQEGCNATLSQAKSDLNYGTPLSFYPADSGETVIYVSKSLNVKFDTPVPCAKSTVWKASRLDPMTRSALIEIGGETGNPGCETIGNWFKIERAGSFPFSYKIVFNPDDVCSNLDVSYTLTAFPFSTGETMPVVLPFGSGGSERDLQVVFRKYEDDDSGIKNGHQAKPYITM